MTRKFEDTKKAIRDAVNQRKTTHGQTKGRKIPKGQSEMP